MQNREIDIIGVQTDLGASKRGVNMGPMAMRYGGLCEGIRELGYNIYDLGDIFPMATGESKATMRNYQQVADINRRLYNIVSESLEIRHFPIVLGGDHSIAAGSISAVAKYYANRGGIGIIWMDAHGDWNDPESSPSGNMHGMPFSAVCGYGPACMVDYGQHPVYVDPAHCVQIGGRNIDGKERLRMKQAGITVFSINTIDRLGMDIVMQRAIEIAGKETAGIYLSFDIDVITPEVAPGTGTVVHGGLTAREAFLAAEALAESGQLVSLDMVEINPIFDERNKTGILASELIQSAMGKSVY